MAAGSEQLLNLAETIIFSLPLDDEVVQKYKKVRRQIQNSVPTGTSREPDSSDIESMRSASLREALRSFKRKNCLLRKENAKLQVEIEQASTRNTETRKFDAREQQSELERRVESMRAAEAKKYARHLTRLEEKLRREFMGVRNNLQSAVDSAQRLSKDVQSRMTTLRSFYTEEFGPSVASSGACEEGSSEHEMARECAEFFDKIHRLLVHRRSEVSQNEILRSENEQLKSAYNTESRRCHELEQTIKIIEQELDEDSRQSLELTSEVCSTREKLKEHLSCNSVDVPAN
eukprot:155634_1